MKIDFDHFQGAQLADIQNQILQEKSSFQLIEMLKPEFGKDGNMYCFTYPNNQALYPHYIQGFGKTPAEAANSFIRAWYNGEG